MTLDWQEIHQSTHWDAIVIGTGIGGGTAGRALAEAGLKVLFLERGQKGLRSERNGLSETPLPEARLARGLWPEPLNVTLDGQELALFAPLGAGVGGSSSFYAATLERPERHDLEETATQPHPTGGWPGGYDAMAPWFDKAAQLYALHGTDDPLSSEAPLAVREPPKPATPTEKAVTEALQKAGLHPYHAHTAMLREEGCLGCTGHRCPRACKKDGRSAGVEPALATGHATLLDRAEVTRLLCENNKITGVEVTVDGTPGLFRADRILLAAGALNSPRLLLASADEANPTGLANGSGMVGRNLMFHLNEMIALWPPRGTEDSGATKTVSFRDFYHQAGQRFGTVQAMGIPVGYGEIVHYLSMTAMRTPLRRLPGLGIFLRLVAAIAAKVFGQAQIFVGLLEDLPYPENRVVYDPKRPRHFAVEYKIAPELLQRRRAFRKAIFKGLKGMRRVFLGALPEPNYGHPCGTLRFGTDPDTSVVNADCRAHQVENLWVVDASFMPTSMGVNPSLTIAANALRVADGIVQSHNKESQT